MTFGQFAARVLFVVAVALALLFVVTVPVIPRRR